MEGGGGGGGGGKKSFTKVHERRSVATWRYTWETLVARKVFVLQSTLLFGCILGRSLGSKIPPEKLFGAIYWGYIDLHEWLILMLNNGRVNAGQYT